MRFESDFIEQVRDANNIVDIIGQYTDLKGRGSQHMGLCPFPDHNEKSPSFSVSEQKQVYHCFGCKKSGNIFTFLEQHNGMMFTDAVEFLARKANIPIPENQKGSVDTGQRASLFKTNLYAASFFHRKLKELAPDHPLNVYLQKRGITQETIDEFKMGFAPDAWSDLGQFFRQKQVPAESAVSLGLLKERKKGNGHFDLFRNRLMFPIFSPQEDVLGFGGRVLTKEDQPKYLNSPESKVFAKGRTFYGLNLSGKHTRQENCAIVVEGYMDFIALYQAGFKNVVATLGTAMTADHVRSLKRYTTRVLLMFDGDFAGQQAAERSLQIIFSQGLCPLAVFLPDGLDPDDYLKQKGAESLRESIGSAEELFIILLQSWLKGFRYTNIEKLELVQKAKPYLESISDMSLKSLYIGEVAKRLSVEERWVSEQIAKKMAPVARPAEAASIPPPTEASQPAAASKVSLKDVPKDELYILGLGLNSSELLDKIVDSQVLGALSSSGLQVLLGHVIDKYRQNPSDFDKLAASMMMRVEQPGEITELFNFWSRNGEEKELAAALEKCVNRVKERYLRRQSAIIASQLHNGASQEKLEQIMNINRDRIQLHRRDEGESAKGDA